MIFFEILVFGFLGLVLGSFATAVNYRESINESWWTVSRKENKHRSFCPSCKHPLSSRDLIPIFSFVFQKGACRYCQEKIPSRYFFIENALLILTLGLYSAVGFTVQSFIYAFSVPFLLAFVLLLALFQRFSLRMVIIASLFLTIGGICHIFV